METVRYYQRRGLFPEPPRQPRGVREYSPEALELLRFIRKARGLGFTIREVERLVALRRGGRRDPQELVSLLTAKAETLEKQIRELQGAVTMLQELAAKAADGGIPEGRWGALESSGD